MQPKVEAPPEAWEGVARVAVLPPDNWTTDIGIEYVAWYRAVLHELLRERGYEVVPLAEVNRFMSRNRFALAGEIRMYSAEELAKEFTADALLFWDVTGGGPTVNLFLAKADGTPLWGTGEVHLSLPFNAYTRGSFNRADERFVLALSEILRHLPPRRPA